MSLDILNRLQQAQSEEERERLVLEFSLNQMPAVMQMVVKAIAIPHWFDVNYLGALLDSERKEEFEKIDGFSQLTQLSFIEPFSGRGFNVHEHTSRLLRTKLWEEEQDLYRELNRRAAEYCMSQDQNDTGWHIETIYHLLLADQPEASDLFIEQGIKWHNSFESEKVEVLIRPVLEAIKDGRLDGRVASWAYYRQGRLDIQYGRNMEAKTNLESALKVTGSDRTAEATIIKALGDVHVRLDEYNEALTCYEQAFPMYQAIGDRLGEANVIKSLGDVHVMLDEYSKAWKRYKQALPLYQTIGSRLGEANVIKALGDVYVMLAKYYEAQTHYEQALILYQTIGDRMDEASVIKALGDLQGEMEHIVEAVSLLQDAATRFKTLGMITSESNCWNSIGNLWNAQERFPEAIKAYNVAIELKPEALWFRNRANTYAEMKEFKSALQDLEQAEKLHPGQPYVRYHRGRIALWQQQVDQALLNLQEAVAMRPGNNAFQFWLAIALLVNNHPEEARHTLQIAIDLTYKEKELSDSRTELQEMAALYSLVPGFDLLEQTVKKALESFKKSK